MRVIIVDDEPLAREGLLMSLAQEDDVEVVSVCCNGEEAVEALQKLATDVVFLDISMPGMSGFDVIRRVGTKALPLTVFLTAHSEFAVEAFSVNALDYLLKPVDEIRLTETLNKCRETLRLQQLNGVHHELSRVLQELHDLGGKKACLRESSPKRIMIRSAGRVYFVRSDEIHWVEAEGDYVRLHTATRAHLIHETMKRMECKLAPLGFSRIHRSSLVKIDMIRELVLNESGDYAVVLQNDTVLKLSRNYRDELYERMKSFSESVS